MFVLVRPSSVKQVKLLSGCVGVVVEWAFSLSPSPSNRPRLQAMSLQRSQGKRDPSAVQAELMAQC